MYSSPQTAPSGAYAAGGVRIDVGVDHAVRQVRGDDVSDAAEGGVVGMDGRLRAVLEGDHRDRPVFDVLRLRRQVAPLLRDRGKPGELGDVGQDGPRPDGAPVSP